MITDNYDLAVQFTLVLQNTLVPFIALFLFSGSAALFF